LGGDCSNFGTTWFNLRSRSGWWRASNHTLQFYECFIRSYCLSGEAYAQSFDDSYGGPSSWEIDIDDAQNGHLTLYDPVPMHATAMLQYEAGGCAFEDSATPCSDNRCGIMCAFCRPGYQSDMSGACTPCPSGAGSWVFLVFLALLVIALILVQFYFLLRADRELLAGMDASAINAADISDFEEESSEGSLKSSSGGSKSGRGSNSRSSSSGGGSSSGSGSDESESGSGASSSEEDEEDESGSDSVSTSRTGSSTDDEDGSAASAHKDADDDDAAAGVLAPEPSNEELAALYLPPTPRSVHGLCTKLICCLCV
jgi:hypothetical protein